MKFPFLRPSVRDISGASPIDEVRDARESTARVETVSTRAAVFHRSTTDDGYRVPRSRMLTSSGTVRRRPAWLFLCSTKRAFTPWSIIRTISSSERPR